MGGLPFFVVPPPHTHTRVCCVMWCVCTGARSRLSNVGTRARARSGRDHSREETIDASAFVSRPTPRHLRSLSALPRHPLAAAWLARVRPLLHAPHPTSSHMPAPPTPTTMRRACARLASRLASPSGRVPVASPSAFGALAPQWRPAGSATNTRAVAGRPGLLLLPPRRLLAAAAVQAADAAAGAASKTGGEAATLGKGGAVAAATAVELPTSDESDELLRIRHSVSGFGREGGLCVCVACVCGFGRETATGEREGR